MTKFNTYTDHMLYLAINDCHATLREGQYSPDHPYGRKLWAEIDAIRAVQMARSAEAQLTFNRLKKELAQSSGKAA